MQIRERDRSEAFDESFVGYSNGVVACAGRVHARREGVKWVEGVGRLRRRIFSVEALFLLLLDTRYSPFLLIQRGIRSET